MKDLICLSHPLPQWTPLISVISPEISFSTHLVYSAVPQKVSPRRRDRMEQVPLQDPPVPRPTSPGNNRVAKPEAFPFIAGLPSFQKILNAQDQNCTFTCLCPPSYKTWNIIQDTGVTHVDGDKEDLGIFISWIDSAMANVVFALRSFIIQFRQHTRRGCGSSDSWGTDVAASPHSSSKHSELSAVPPSCVWPGWGAHDALIEQVLDLTGCDQIESWKAFLILHSIHLHQRGPPARAYGISAAIITRKRFLERCPRK